MSSGIELGRDWEKSPAHLCGHCKKELHLVIDAWKPDITKVIRSNCPHCGGEIYAGLFIVSDTSLRNVLEAIQSVVKAFTDAGGNVTEVDNPDGGRIIH